MDPLHWEVIGIFVCLALSAFFSGSETALTSLTSSKAQQLVEEGKPWLQLWLDRPIPVLTTILIGNNIVNVAASALATDVAHRMLSGTGSEDWAIPAAIGVMTFLLLTFGEITPKAVSKRLFENVSSFSIRILRPLYWVLTPLTRMFVAFTQLIMRLLGNEPNERAPYVTYEEIEYLIALGAREGSFTEERVGLLKSVVEFPDTVVREVMVPRTDMIALACDLSLEDVLQTLMQCGHSRLPVYEGTIDNIVGMFYAKDIIRLMAEGQDAEFDLMNYLRASYFVPESKRIADLLSEFQGNRTHIAIVVDEFGGTAGIITLEDIIEEIFGDIQDEYDVEPEQIVELGPNRVRADARVSIYEIEEYFHIELPEHPDYESLGGLVLAQKGSVPRVGEEFEWEGLCFRVVDAEPKKVITVEIERLEPPDETLVEEATG